MGGGIGGGCSFLPKASPDWLGQNKDDVKLADKEKDTYLTRCKAFMQSEEKKKKGPPKLLQRMLANKYYVRCLDHSLACGSGLCLQDFVVADPPPAALKAGETRYGVNIEELPGAIQACAFDRTCKVCIELENGTTRYECQSVGGRRVLMVSSDQGAIGWPSWYYIYCHLQVRGWFFPDPSHRRNDNHINAFAAAGVAWIKNEMLMLASVGSAPWRGCAHFGVYSEAAAECPLWT